MRFVTYAENIAQLKSLACLVENKRIDTSELEVIVGTSAISRYSKNTVVDLEDMIAQNQKYKLPLVLEWDILQQESLFQRNARLVSGLPLKAFKAIRLQDPGAINYIKENYPSLKIQLILESGNHNYVGLSRWSEFLGAQLDRLVLSNELSRDHLRLYAAQLKTDIEILVFGRILLFYSPRQLLSPLRKEEIKAELSQKNIEAFGTSEESPHSGFPIIENSHGTFMFNVKDLYLLDQLEELRLLNTCAVRFDLRYDGSLQYLEKCIDLFKNKIKHEEVLEIKSQHPRPMIKGFYNINKTDVLFSKLKNRKIQRKDDNYIGEIVDVERDQQMALLIKSKHQSLKAGDELQLITPEGKIKTFGLKHFSDTSGQKKESAIINEVVLLPFISGIVTRTQVYLK